ncbi:PadR family transcriptional regulator [Candidatus Dojkabacteria bacterium]|nr:PadR family transcriptional regulator [Candidatus Dojkabacteria bacterium]
MNYSKELLKGTTNTMILTSLNSGDKYGYQIIKQIKQLSDNSLKLGEGTIYPILHKLERGRMLESYWIEQENLPKRKYYHITEKGKRKIKEAREEWKKFSTLIDKLFFNTKSFILNEK